MLAAMVVAALPGCEEQELGAADEPVPSATILVDNKLEDAPYADFCVRGEGAWLGPVVHRFDNQPDGLPRDTVGGPYPLAIGTYQARLTDPATRLCYPALNDKDYELAFEPLKYRVTISGYVAPGPGQAEVGLTTETIP
jgi:hypothetical protein